MRRAGALCAILVLAAAFLVGCSGSDETGPPTIRYGRSVCEHCHMIISDPRTAAAYRTAAGKARVFDDIGDLLSFGRDSDELAGARVWVHDYGTEAWVAADAAWFVTGSGVETPMGGGIVAFATGESARRFVTRSGGQIVRWPELARTPPE